MKAVHVENVEGVTVCFIDKRRARISKLQRHLYNVGEHMQETYDDLHPVFVTLTYAEDTWQPNHIRNYIHTVRKWLQRREAPCIYAWVAELQKRDVIHYHLIFWLPTGTLLPKPDLSGQWPHGTTNIQKAKKSVAYLMKYCSKLEEIDKFPKGVRLHGSGGIDQMGKQRIRWFAISRTKRERFNDDKLDNHPWYRHDLRKTTGGVEDRLTGQWEKSNGTLLGSTTRSCAFAICTDNGRFTPPTGFCTAFSKLWTAVEYGLRHENGNPYFTTTPTNTKPDPTGT